MMVVKKIGVLSCAKIQAVVLAILGLIIGVLYGIIGFFIALAAPHEFGSNFPAVIFVLMPIIMPIFYGILGFISGAIGAFVYNIVAKWIGGLEVEIEQKN